MALKCGAQKCQYAEYQAEISELFHCCASSSFWEHATAMIPMKRLRMERRKAMPNPILRVLPHIPTPIASERAMNNKNACSIILSC